MNLSLLSEAEERQLVYDWNAVAPYSAPKRLLHELFEDQAERTPGNVALVLDDEKLITVSRMRGLTTSRHTSTSLGRTRKTRRVAPYRRSERAARVYARRCSPAGAVDAATVD